MTAVVAGPVRRYRWVVLTASVLASGAYSAARFGMPALGPQLSQAFDVSLATMGVVLGSMALGQMLTSYPWGTLADRFGEQLVMPVGLVGAGATLTVAAFAGTLPALVTALALTGMLGAVANTGSGRAVMGWFPARERGTALGIRQMALPLGGALAAMVLPAIVRTTSLRAAFLTLAALQLAGAFISGVWLRKPATNGAARSEPRVGPVPLRDRRLWRLASGSACLLAAQSAIQSFLALFLHGQYGMAPAPAAAFLAVMWLCGAAVRPLVGLWSDRTGGRVRQMRRIALTGAALLIATALAATVHEAPAAVVITLLVPAGIVSMSWNGLAYTAAMELAGPGRAGSALGLQTTVIAVATALMPPIFGAVVQFTAWPVGFAVLAVAQVAGALRLAPLIPEEEMRMVGTGAVAHSQVR
jgi:sugar phosphate permease